MSNNTIIQYYSLILNVSFSARVFLELKKYAEAVIQFKAMLEVSE